MKIARKLVSLAAMALVSTAAFADPVINFDLKGGATGPTYVTGADTLDWNQQGSGVAVGVGPFNASGLLPIGAEFQFLYQANLVSVGGGTNNPALAGLDFTSNGSLDAGKNFEFTIVSKMVERVIDSRTTGTGNSYAEFGLGGNSTTNKVAIYYDTAANSNTLAGTGFDDGIMVAMLTIVSEGTESSFTANPRNNTGQGGARLRAIQVETTDFVNADYLAGLQELIFGMAFEGTLNFPANSAYANAFHAGGDQTLFPTFTVGANDIVFKVDGSNQFTAEVPEPGSIMLMGMGLLGLVGATRRRKNTK